MSQRTAPLYGSPVLPPRFWAKAEPSTAGCWLWVGATSTSGYGTFTVEGKTQRAHRVAFSNLVGEIPEGLVIDHLCRVRNCVNPAHLEPVTNQVNLLRGETSAAENARRTHCNYGHEFTPANVLMDKGKRRCKTCKYERRAATRRAA